MKPVSATSSPGIVVDNITVTYRNGLTALRNATFQIPAGSIGALVGVNGSGKSTIFKAIMGFVPLAAGRIDIRGGSVEHALANNHIAFGPKHQSRSIADESRILDRSGPFQASESLTGCCVVQ